METMLPYIETTKTYFIKFKVKDELGKFKQHSEMVESKSYSQAWKKIVEKYNFSILVEDIKEFKN